MVLSLKVGYLVPGVVVKSMPDYDSHLILISGTELLAFLPKKYANRPYKVGQNLVAAIFLLENQGLSSPRGPILTTSASWNASSAPLSRKERSGSEGPSR